MNNSFKDQLTAIKNKDHPFVRRDKEARARIIADIGGEQLLIETVVPALYNRNPVIRVVSKEYFDNNFWEGKD